MKPATLLPLALLVACQPGDFNGSTYDALLSQAVAAGLPGVALYVSSPDGDFDGAAGESEIGVTDYAPTDMFRIASNSKSFLGVVAAGLADEGALDLDAPLADHLDAALVANIANADTATLRQALQHTSGIPDYLDEGFYAEVDAGRSTGWTPEEALTYAYGMPASFTPGSDWEYSNTNYLLAGLVIDDVTGHHHAVEIRTRILDPLGMSRSYYEEQETLPGTLVHGYSYYFDDTLFDTSELEQGYGLADGGMVATAADLGTYVRALSVGNDVLTDSARDILFGDLVSTGEGDDYGLGISIFPTDFGDAVGHGGQIEGYTSEMYYYPDDDVTIVAFMNTSAGDYDPDVDPEDTFADFLIAVEDLTF